MFTPASLIAAAILASEPGVFSTSITKSTAMPRMKSRSGRFSFTSFERRAHSPVGLDDPAVRPMRHQRRGFEPTGRAVLDLDLQRRLERLLHDRLPVRRVVDVAGEVEIGAADRPRPC